MSISDILEQAKNLKPQERKELVKLLIDLIDVPEPSSPSKTGAEIAAFLATMPPIEFVDEDIQDPVEWVKAQRQKRAEKLKPYWDGEK